MITDLQEILTNKLKNQFPSATCLAYSETLFDDTDNFLSFNAPAIFVVILPQLFNLTPKEKEIFDCRLGWGVVVVTDQTSQEEGVKSGWDLTEKVCSFLKQSRITHRESVWQLEQISCSRQERVDRTGTPTGAYYWPITYSQLYNYDDRL